MYLSEREILPHIQLARFYDTVAAGVTGKTRPRTLDCYEMGYYVTDGGSLCINGDIYQIKKGDMRFMKPRDVISSEPAYQCFTIFFHLGEQKETYHNEFIDSIPRYFHAESGLQTLMEQVAELSASQEPGAIVMQNGLLMQLMYQCCRLFRPHGRYCSAVAQCMAYMKDNLEKNITLDMLGEVSGYSPIHIRRLFCRDTMLTPHEYMGRLRMGRARELLQDTELPVNQIASACGYSSESHFQILFKKMNGCTPGSYRRKARML